MQDFVSFDCGYKPLAFSVLTINTRIRDDILDRSEGVADAADAFVSALGALLGAHITLADLARSNQTTANRSTESRVAGPARSKAELADEFCSSASQYLAVLTDLRNILRDSIRVRACVAGNLTDKNISELTMPTRAAILDSYLRRTVDRYMTAGDNGLPPTVLIEEQPTKIGPKTNTVTLPLEAMLTMWFVTRHGDEDSVVRVDNSVKCQVDLDPANTYAIIRGRCKTSYEARKAHTMANIAWLSRVHPSISTARASIRNAYLSDVDDSLMQAISYALRVR